MSIFITPDRVLGTFAQSFHHTMHIYDICLKHFVNDSFNHFKIWFYKTFFQLNWNISNSSINFETFQRTAGTTVPWFLQPTKNVPNRYLLCWKNNLLIFIQDCKNSPCLPRYIELFYTPWSGHKTGVQSNTILLCYWGFDGKTY